MPCFLSFCYDMVCNLSTRESAILDRFSCSRYRFGTTHILVCFRYYGNALEHQ